MRLRVASHVVWPDIDDLSLVNVAWRDVSGCNEVSEPLSCEGIVFIVVRASIHPRASVSARAFNAAEHRARATVVKWHERIFVNPNAVRPCRGWKILTADCAALRQQSQRGVDGGSVLWHDD